MRFNYSSIIGVAIVMLAPQIAQALTITEIETIAQQITVKLLSSTPGSGVIIARQGNTYYVLTARHVIESLQSGDEADVETYDGKLHRVNTDNIQKLPNNLDLAIVEFTASENYQVATLSSYQDPLYLNRDYEQGWSDSEREKPYVFVAGWVLDKSQFVFNPGLLFDNSATAISNPDILNPEAVEQDFRGYELTYTNLTAPGMSGGPVLDSNGRLIGIHGRADGKEIDENDLVTQEYLVEAGLTSIRVKVGLSAGIPIQTFLSWVKQNQINTQLITEDTPPVSMAVSTINTAWQPQLAVSDRNNPLYWLELGNQLWRLQRFTEAIAAFDQGIKINDQLPLLWFAKGFTLGFNREYEKAFGACARATQLQPEDYNSWRCQAGALQELQRYREALNTLNQALAYNDKNPADWAIKGELHIARQEYDQALAAFERAIALRSNYGLPDSAVLLNSKGLTLLALQRREEALEMFNQAIALNPDYASAWSNFGWALSELNRHQESLEAYDRALELDPNSANTWYNRGVTLYQLQLDAEAIASFQRALTINPNYQPAIDALNQLKP